MIEHQPSFAGFNRSCPGADLYALPPFTAAAHHVPVLSPEGHVRAFADEDVAEGRVSAVRGPAQQPVGPADLPRKQHRVPVEGNERILDPRKGPEVLRLRHADGSAVKIPAPDDVVRILHLHQPGVVSIVRHLRLPVFVRKGHLLPLHIPMDAVFGMSEVNVGNPVDLFAPQHRDVPVLPRHHRTVENPRDFRCGIPAHHRISAVAPNRRFGLHLRRPVLPGNVGQRVHIDHLHFSHLGSPPSFFLVFPGFPLRFIDSPEDPPVSAAGTFFRCDRDISIPPPPVSRRRFRLL